MPDAECHGALSALTEVYKLPAKIISRQKNGITELVAPFI
jgi:hypothetical protein